MIAGLKLSPLPTFAVDACDKFSCDTSGTDWIHALVSRKSYPSYHHFILYWGMHVQNNNITATTL
jgi:hypothetical protein